MKRILLLTLLVALALTATGAASATATQQAASMAWCGGSQTWQSVRSSLNRPAIRVKARVARVYYASNTRGRPTFIDLGNPYPSRNRVTVVIWGEDRVNFPYAPERMFKPGQVICAQGAASMYSGAPQIQVALWDGESRLLSF